MVVTATAVLSMVEAVVMKAGGGNGVDDGGIGGDGGDDDDDCSDCSVNGSGDNVDDCSDGEMAAVPMSMSIAMLLVCGGNGAAMTAARNLAT